MAYVGQSAATLRSILAAQGHLSLWEARAILNESRANVMQVLFWMAARKEIDYRLEDEELSVTLSGQARPRRSGSSLAAMSYAHQEGKRA